MSRLQLDPLNLMIYQNLTKWLRTSTQYPQTVQRKFSEVLNWQFCQNFHFDKNILAVDTWWMPFKSYLETKKNMTWNQLHSNTDFHSHLRYNNKDI